MRLKVTSRKFTTCKFASAVIFKSNCSKTLWSSFFVLSAKRADLFLIIARPSKPLDETGCSGKFFEVFCTIIRFALFYMSLSSLLYFANQN